VIVELMGKPETAMKTKVIKRNLNPEWKETVTLKDVLPTDSLKFTVMDKDYGKRDDFLGEAILTNGEFFPNGFGPEELLLDQKGLKYDVVQVKVDKEGPLGIEIDEAPRGGVVLKSMDEENMISKLSKGKVVRGMLLKDVDGHEILNVDQACDLLQDRPVNITFEAHPTIQIQVVVLNAPPSVGASSFCQSQQMGSAIPQPCRSEVPSSAAATPLQLHSQKLQPSSTKESFPSQAVQPSSAAATAAVQENFTSQSAQPSSIAGGQFRPPSRCQSAAPQQSDAGWQSQPWQPTSTSARPEQQWQQQIPSQPSYQGSMLPQAIVDPRPTPGAVVPAPASTAAFDQANSIPPSTGSCRWHAGPPSSHQLRPLDSSRVASVEFSARPPQSFQAMSSASVPQVASTALRVHVGQAAGFEGGGLRYAVCELMDKPHSRQTTTPREVCDWNEVLMLPSFEPGDVLRIAIFLQEAWPQQDVCLAMGEMASEMFFPNGMSEALVLDPLEEEMSMPPRIGLGIDVVDTEPSMLDGGDQRQYESLVSEQVGIPAYPSEMAMLQDAGPKRLSVLITRAQGLTSEVQPSERRWFIDPYCVFEIIGKPHTQFATQVATHTANPAWNDEHEIDDYVHGDALRFVILNKAGLDPSVAANSFVDSMAEDDEILGEVILEGAQFDPFGLNAWIPLARASRRYAGLLRVRVCIIGSPFRPKMSSQAPPASWGSVWFPGMDPHPCP